MGSELEKGELMARRKVSDLITAEKYEPEDEWLILSHCIMSSLVISHAYKKYKIGQLKTKHFDQYMQHIFRWLMRYYKNYEKAPKATINEIFNYYKKSMGKERSAIVEEYLDRLADEYVNFQDSGINPEFINREVMPRFIRRQEAEAMVESIRKKLDADRPDEVEQLIAEYTPITDEEEDPDIGTMKPGSARQVRKYYGEEKDKGALFKLPGPVGDFMGPIYRGKLVAITGVEKSGKTHFLQEIGYHAVLYHKLKVLDICLEMPNEDKAERFWQRLGKYSVDEDHAGRIVVPVFDCENNQQGTCEIRKKLPNRKALFDSPDDVAIYEEQKHWRICTRCRGEVQRKNAKRTKKFVPAIWYRSTLVRPITENRMIRTINKFAPYGIGNYRVKCFPRFSVTFDEVYHYIKTYIRQKNFRPDVILIDYPDIMRPIDGDLMDRFNIDYNWKRCSGMGQELDCAVIVPDQAIKAAREKNRLSVMSTSESKTKDAHLDMRLALNKTALEAALGLQRLGMLFRRKGRLLSGEIMMLQRLETCDVLLDSEWWFSSKNSYRAVNLGENIPEIFK
jgi:hypothetical protein